MAENDDDLDGQHDDDNTPKDLRKALGKAHKELEDLKVELGQLRAVQRVESIGKLLAEKGLPEKVAKLLPDSVLADAESIDKWLADFGDVFTSKEGEANAADSAGDAAIDDATRQAHERVAAATAGATSGGTSADILSKIQNAETPAALAEILAGTQT